MELKQCVMRKTYAKGKTQTQMVLGEDYSLTEGKPDIEKLLQKKAEVRVEEVHTEKGRIRVKGKLHLWVLYLPMHSGETLGTLNTEIPFEELLHLEEVVHGDQLKIGWNIDELKVQIVHPGKINIRSVVTLSANIWSEEDVLVTEDVQGSRDIFTKVETFEAAACVMNQKEIYHIEEQLELPANMPNVERLLWSVLQLRNAQAIPQEGRVAVSGELLFWTVYEGEGTMEELRWMEKTIAFQGFLEVPGIKKTAFGVPKLELSEQTIQIQPDRDGELRVFHLSAAMELWLHMYEEGSYRCLTDAYSMQQEISMATEPIFYEKLRMCDTFKCPVSGQAKLPDTRGISGIVGHYANLKKATVRETDQGLVWESMLEVQVLYQTADLVTGFAATELLIPCSQVIEVVGMQKEDIWNLSPQPEQLFITYDEDSVKVQGILNLSVCVLEQCKGQNITGIQMEEEDLKGRKNRPGMLVHFVQPGETLWDIAKEHRSSMEVLKAENELGEGEVQAGQKLLLFHEPAEKLFS